MHLICKHNTAVHQRCLPFFRFMRRFKMIRISNINYSVLRDEENLPEFIAKKYKLASIRDFKITKQSIDARKKDDVHYVYTVELATDNESKLIKKHKNISKPVLTKYNPPKPADTNKKIVVAGFGPAGIMASYLLVNAGFEVVVLERGESVDERIKSVEKLKREGILNPESNIQFGEGGAGTFSDGKLTTGINDIRTSYVLSEFAKHGAPNEILYRSKPHIGTDNLVGMVKNFRRDILNSGGQIKFSHKLCGINISDGKLKSVSVENNGEVYDISADVLIIATGHSAIDVFEMLKKNNAKLERKVFAIGARIEHPREVINYSQYGEMHKLLPAADYKLAVKTSNGRSVYTFCMCPGGEVVASASETGGVVTNGMSCFARDAENSNSALLVNVTPDDLTGDDVLEGFRFQREIEKKAFDLCGGYFAPCQSVGDFLNGDNSEITVNPSYRPGVKKCDLKDVLPRFVYDSIREAIPMLDKKLKGFANSGAVLTAPETRSSSPVRIVRDSETLMSNIDGVYPCGEGAGYAGGIMTAAVDGIKVAEAIIKGDKNGKEQQHY